MIQVAARMGVRGKDVLATEGRMNHFLFWLAGCCALVMKAGRVEFGQLDRL